MKSLPLAELEVRTLIEEDNEHWREGDALALAVVLVRETLCQVTILCQGLPW